MSGPVAQEFEAANKSYAESFTKGDLALPPARYTRPSPMAIWDVLWSNIVFAGRWPS